MLVETHAHLDYLDFVHDLDSVLRRATEAGVTRVVTIGTSIESSRRAIDLAERYPAVYATVGVHPTYVQEAEEDVFTPLRELAKHPKVVAIGETGLDYHHLPSEKPTCTPADDERYKGKQSQLFQQQLEVAAELGLNCVIHQRDCFDATLAELAPFANKVSG